MTEKRSALIIANYEFEYYVPKLGLTTMGNPYSCDFSQKVLEAI